MPDVYDQALSGATPQPQTNAYDALLDQQDQQQNQQLMQSIAQNAGKDANLEGEAQRLGFKTGVGPDIAKNNMAEVRRRAAVIDAQNRQLTETSPILARQLSDPSFAAIAHDQLDNLSTHEKIWNWLKTQSPVNFQAIDGMVPSVSINPDIPNQWEAGQLQHEVGLLGFKAGTGGASAEDWTRINEIKQRLSQLGPQKSFLGGATQMAGQMKDMGIGALGAGAVGGLIAGGATAWASGGLAAEAVPEASMLGAKLGASVWASQDIYRMTAGQTYLDMLDKGINQSTAQYAAAGVGMINTALMMGGTKVATAPFAKALNAAMGEKLSEAMVRPTVARAMRSIAGEWALGSVEGGGAMALQTVVSQVGEDVAKSYDKGQLEIVLSTPEGRSEFAGRVVDSFVTGLTLTGLTGAAGSMLRLHVEAGKVAEAQRSQQFFESLSQNAADSEVRKRNPNAYENFVASQAKGTNAESVYVDGQKMAEVLNQSGLDPEQVEKVLPGMSEKVAEAAQTGGDVTIPTSQYAANLAGTELGKAMLPHMRLDPDGISAAEAEAFAQNHQSMLAEAKATAQQQMSTNEEFAKSAKVVEGNIFDQLKATKTMPDDVARTNAQFMRDLIVTQAADMKITPEEFYQRFKPTIERATGGPLAQSVFHGSPYHFDKFTLDKIGAGEGAQAYGHGLYFAGDREVSEYYRSSVTGRMGRGRFLLDGEPMTQEKSYSLWRALDRVNPGDSIEKTIKGLKEHAKFATSQYGDATGNMYTDAAETLESYKDRITENHGQVYEADIPEDHTMLDWDKPLSEQPEAVKKALGVEASMDAKIVMPNGEHLNRDSRGESAYHAIAEGKGSAEAASNYLHSLGINGIKYLDGSSRSAGEGSHNYVVFDDNAIKVLKTFYQAEKAGGARGGFDPSRLAILLNDKADFSTFAHETGHYYLSVIGDLAKDDTAPGRYKHDMQTLLNWFGVKDLDTWHSMSLDEQRKFHEQFAYSFEKYLAEGKAPSLEMQGVFDRFSMWLKRVYVSVRDDLNSIYRKQHGEDLPVLTGEVRGVMDRMLASDDQIKQAEAVRNMEPMFRSAEEAEMKPEEWAAYQEMHRDATGSASSDLSSASIRQMQWLSNARSRVLKELQKQHDALRDKVREEVTAEVMEQPIHQAMADLKEGKDPELVALAHGFDSKDDMMGQRVTKKALKEQVASLTDQRMTERYGEMNDPKAMEREVEKALHNEARARFVAVELRHLAKATEPVRVMLKAAELTAKNILGSKPLSEVKPSEYSASEARAARAAIDAMKKGDSEGAAKAKQNQLVQNALAKESLSIRDEADKKLKYLGKFDNLSTSVTKSIGADYMDRINELLSGYEISKRATHGQGREDISSWVLSEYNKTGIMPAVSPDTIAQMGTMHWKDMSINQLRDLHDAVKSLDYIGRRRTEVEIAGKVQTVDELIQEVRNNLAGVTHTEPVDVRSDMRHAKGLDKINASWLYAKGKIRSMDAALLKMEQFFQWLDAGKDAGVSEAPADGPMQRIFHMASSAEGKERAMRAESSRALRELGDNLKGAKIDLHESLDIPELPRADGSTKWYREGLIAVALNMGNESNKQKLLEGYNWSEERAVGAINRLMSKPEMDFVQGVWDHIGTYGKDIVELQRRQTGVMPKMIEGSTLVTAHGAYPGGYYPAVYDSFIDRSIEEKEARSADRLFENNYANPATSTGHTIERTGYKGPIWLDLSVISRHIDQVTHDLAWREAITDMNKVLSDPRLHREVDQTYGREYAAQFRPWLQAMANDRVFNTSGDAGWEWLVRKARTNATMVGVGFRMSTLMIHGTSALSNSLGELGTRWFAKGVQQFIGADRIKETRDFIFARSPEMKHRMDAVDRNMTEVINEINKNQDFLTTQGVIGKIYDSSRKFACYGVAMSDMASAMPTWMGAYLKGMAKDGLNLSEADAVEYANRSVRNAHGGGGTKDLASAQRDRGVTSLFTMFYSFWNHMYNRQRDLGKGWQQAATGQAGTRNLPRLLARSWFYFVVPQLAHVLLKPSPAEKKDEGDLGSFAKRIGEDIGAGFLSGLPVFRDMASAAINGRDYTVTPLEQVGKSIVTTIENGMKVAQGEPTSKRASQTAAEAAGYVFGIPTSQPAATTRFLWDVLNGDQQPDDMKDWWSGILTGKIAR